MNRKPLPVPSSVAFSFHDRLVITGGPRRGPAFCCEECGDPLEHSGWISIAWPYVAELDQLAVGHLGRKLWNLLGLDSLPADGGGEVRYPTSTQDLAATFNELEAAERTLEFRRGALGWDVEGQRELSALQGMVQRLQAFVDHLISCGVQEIIVETESPDYADSIPLVQLALPLGAENDGHEQESD